MKEQEFFEVVLLLLGNVFWENQWKPIMPILYCIFSVEYTSIFTEPDFPALLPGLDMR